KGMDFFTDQEWATLEAEAEKTWKKQYGVPDAEEATAQAFAGWRQGAGPKEGPIRRIFNKMAQFFVRLKNLLKGRGFKSVDDVFAKVETGEVGARKAKGAEVPSSLAPVPISAGKAKVAQRLSLGKPNIPAFRKNRLQKEASQEIGKKEEDPQMRVWVGPDLADTNAFKRIAVSPRTNASLDKDLVPAYMAILERKQIRDEVASKLAEPMGPWLAGSKTERRHVNAALELDRLDHKVHLAGKKTSVTNEDHEDARLSKPGEMITLTDDEKKIYWAWRKTGDKALIMLRDQTIKDFGVDPAQFKGTKRVAQAIADIVTEGSATYDPAIAGDPAKRSDYEILSQIVGEIEAQRVQGYVPFSRFGDVIVAVKETKTVDGPDGKPHKVQETIYSSKVETGRIEKWMHKRGLERIPSVRREMDAVKAKYVAGKPNREMIVFRADSPQAVDDITIGDVDLLAKVARVDSQEYESIRTLFEKVLKARGFKKHFFKAENIPGYSEDFDRALPDYVLGVAGYISRRQTADMWEKAIGGIPTDKGEAIQYAKELRQYNDRPAEEWRTMRQFGFLYYVAGVPMSFVRNITQVPLTTVPYLTQFAGVGRIIVEFAKAYKDAMKMLAPSTLRPGKEFAVFDPKKAPTDLRDDFQAAWDEGNFNPIVTQELMARAFNRQGFNRALDRTIQVVGLNMSASERLNRIASFIASHRLAQDPEVQAKIRKVLANNPLAAEQLLKNFSRRAFGEWVNDETHFVQGKENRPKIAHGPGAAILQFKSSYPAQMLELWYRMARQNGREGRKAFLLSLIATLLVAGTKGLPLVPELQSAIEAGYKLLSGGDDLDLTAEIRQEMYDLSGSPLIATAFSKGAPFAAGVDLSSVGIGRLVPENNWDFMGIPGSMIERPVTAYQQFQRGQTLDAFAEMSPRFIQNMLLGPEWKAKGIRSRATGKMAIPAKQISTLDAIQKMGGLTPTHITTTREADYAVRRAERSIQGTQRQFYMRMAKLEAAFTLAETQGEKDRIKKEVEAEGKRLKEYNKGRKDSEQISLKASTLKNYISQELEGLQAGYGKERKQFREPAEEIRKAYGVK
ncbi:MAG: PLxRFG domain-containing protein, partial [bacterium]|nr:PLxRFG domain-containing protein [bacterium]